METFLEYILKASGILLLFFSVYHLFLKRETFFEANRHFLLSGLLLAFVLPLLTITRYVDQGPQSYPDFEGITAVITDGAVADTLDWTLFLSYIYLAGCLFFMLKFCFELLSLRGMIKRNTAKREDGFVYVTTTAEIAPFSFFNYIIYNPDQYAPEELQAILEHEKAHCSQWHSIDVLLAHLISVVLWANPIGWLYKKNIKQNLEFLADASAAKGVASLKTYQYTLLRVSGIPYATQITNTFYNSLIKKRIVMLHKSKSDKRNVYKYGLVVPLLLLFVFLFNIETKARPIPITEQYAVPELTFETTDRQYVITKESTDEDIASLEDEIKSEGGKLDVKKVKRNGEGHIVSIKISFELGDSEVVGQYSNDEGIPPVKFGKKDSGGLYINGGQGNSHGSHGVNVFHLDTDSDDEHEHDGDYEVIVKSGGKHKVNAHSNVWVSKGSGEAKSIVIEEVNGKKTIIVDGKEVTEDELEKEGVIHKQHIKIRSSDKGDDNVMIFMNDDDDDNDYDHDIKVISAEKNGFFFVDTDGKEPPLYIIDGKEATEEEMKALSPDTIATMNVIKGESAEKEYGDKGKNGVIKITTKNED